MITNKFLFKNLQNFNYIDFLLKCDLVYKYSINNINTIPSYSYVSIKYTNSSLYLDICNNKFQLILFFYFIITYLPTIFYKYNIKNNLCLKIKFTDNEKIKYLLEYLIMEKITILKKKIKTPFFSIENINSSKPIIIQIVFSFKNSLINNELNSIFNEIDILSIEKITLQVKINININLRKKLLSSSKEFFFKNFLYFWFF